MIFTISRYFGTPERIAGLFAKITHQMIRNCQMYAYKRMRDLLLKESTSSSSSSNDTKVTEEEKEEKQKKDDVSEYNSIKQRRRWTMSKKNKRN